MPEIIEPGANFRFTVVVDGVSVAGFSSVTGLKPHNIETFEHRHGDWPAQKYEWGGLEVYDDITLVTGDIFSADFWGWCQSTYNSGSGGGVEDRRSITLEEKMRDGTGIRVWKIKDCLCKTYEISDKDAGTSAAVLDTLTLNPRGYKKGS